MTIRLWILLATTLYQAIAVLLENRTPPPGQRIDIGGYKLHLYGAGPRVLENPEGPQPTIILDHSLGGIEGYLLIDELSKLAPTYAYDRAGYGWSDVSPRRRTSDRIVEELDTLLTRANIQPPYLLIGNSFGSSILAAVFCSSLALLAMVACNSLISILVLGSPLNCGT